jgi:predicted nucleic acid-binding protein
MPSLPRISLDTNIFIFGIRNIDPFSVTILKNLFQFNVRISVQVEKELRNNISHIELKEFYSLIKLLTYFDIVYQQPNTEIFNKYQELGLKTGDAIIAEFCFSENIEILISENRHFLQQLPHQPFEIIESKLFCKKFGL